MTQAERLLFLMEELQFRNMSEFARTLEVTPAYISKIKNNPGCALSPLFLDKVCGVHHVNREWLELGTGEMFKENREEEEIAEFIGNLLKEEPYTFRRRFIHALSMLTDEQWGLLEEMSAHIANLHQKEKE